MTIQKRVIHKTSQNGVENGRLIELYTHKGTTEVYLSTIYPQSFKGWHRHSKLTQQFICIKGEVVIMMVDKHNKRTDVVLLASNPETLTIEKGTAIGIRNVGQEEAFLICMPDPPYDPADVNEKATIDEPYDF
jgi:dTDP-4-dehydrorhamnose 3,5-epimerase-like enzyme